MPFTLPIMMRREMHNPADSFAAGKQGMSVTAHLAIPSLLGLALMAASACVDSTATDPDHGRNSQIVLEASFQQTGSASEEIRVGSSYRLSTGSLVVMSSQSVALGELMQQIPINIDIGRCLADSQRSGMYGSAPVAGECAATLSIQLILNGVSVDSQVVGPLALRAGAVTVVPNAIQLNAIGEVRIAAPAENTMGPGEPLRLEVGKTMWLATRVFDRDGQSVAGRAADWTSSEPSVATVSTGGLVTAIAGGSTRITANVGGSTTSVNVGVVYPSYLLSISSTGRSGSGRLSSSPGGLDCSILGGETSGTCAHLYNGGGVVTISAQALGSESEFASWSGDCADAQGRSCTVTMDRERNVGVAFRALRSLNVSVAGAGSGSVSSSDGQINCSYSNGSANGHCASTFADETKVELSAAVVAPSVFVGWTGQCASTTGSVCLVDMDAARSVTARFELPVSLAVAANGYGSGKVISDPSGISCILSASQGSGDCNSFFLSGSTVTLSATGSDGSTFQEWLGCTSVVGSNCTVVLAGSNKSVSVRFDPPPMLSVSLSGSGAGQVVSNSGIVCTRLDATNFGNCSNVEPYGSEVVLNATAASSSIFGGWSGACVGTGECRVTMDKSKTVGAAFTHPMVQLALILKGPGSGKLYLNNDQVCSRAESAGDQICLVSVELNSTVQLQATAGQNYKVSGYSGMCVTSDDGCVFAITGPGSVVVSFSASRVDFSISGMPSSDGSGSVYINMLDMSCYINRGSTPYPANCRRTLSPSVFQPNLILVASPDSGSQFSGWGGACQSAGMSPTCRLTNPLAVTSVTASFSTRMFNVKVDLAGSTAGTLTANGPGWTRTCSLAAIPTSASCTWLIPAGQPFTISATSGSGYFNSDPGTLCYHTSEICTVSGGLWSDNRLSFMFYGF